MRKAFIRVRKSVRTVCSTMAKKKNLTTYLNVGAVALIGGSLLISMMATSANDEPFDVPERVKGNENAEVVLTEFGDLECPACRAAFPIISELAEEFGDDVKIVYKHFPLTQIHPNAFLAAQATEAAGMQGKFWEMHDVIFEEQPKWARSVNPRASFIRYAEDLGLDVDQFKQQLNATSIKQKVNSDIAEGNALNVRSTPTFALNGEVIQNPGSIEDFRAILRAALQASESGVDLELSPTEPTIASTTEITQ